MAGEAIQPVVLVGGRSRRFGRDKLREPVAGAQGEVWLVDRPIQALAAVFGARVAAVGACDPEVAGRAHLVIEDRYPGAGPIGGVVSALEGAGTAVFVLPGDLPRVTAEAVRLVLAAAGEAGDAAAVLAGSAEAPEPCFGVYRLAALPYLKRAMEEGRHALREALPAEMVRFVSAPEECVVNANTPADLEALEGARVGGGRAAGAASTPPLHRHPALQPLSREHFNGLVQARRLRQAADGSADERRSAVDGFETAWLDEIAPHFDDEERLLGPLASRADAERLRAEHEVIRSLAGEVFALRERCDSDRLRRLGHLLHDHIRWEERSLFPALQASIGDEDLERIAHATQRVEEERPGSRRRGDPRPGSPGS